MIMVLMENMFGFQITNPNTLERKKERKIDVDDDAGISEEQTETKDDDSGYDYGKIQKGIQQGNYGYFYRLADCDHYDKVHFHILKETEKNDNLSIDNTDMGGVLFYNPKENEVNYDPFPVNDNVVYIPFLEEKK